MTDTTNPPDAAPHADPTLHARTRVELAVAGILALGLVLAYFAPRASGYRERQAGVHVARARAAFARGEGEKETGFIELGQALGWDERSRAAHLELGRALGKLDRFDAAEEHYKAALSLGEDGEALSELGLLLLRRGRHAEAAEPFRRWTELDPKSAIAWLDLGFALLGAGRSAEAVPVCRRSVELDSKNLNAKHNLGMALRLSGESAGAIVVLEQVLAGDATRTATLRELVHACLASGDTARARATALRLLALDPHDADAQALLAQATTP